MTVERRFLTGAREADTDEAGLVIEDDGKVWKVAPGGARVEVGVSGGGSFAIGSSFLSCYSVLSTNNAPNGDLIECEFEVAQTIGSDLSLDPDGKTIRVTTTGWYQAAIQVYFGGPMDNFLFGTDSFGDELPELKTYLPALALDYGLDLMFMTPVAKITAGSGFTFHHYADQQAATGTYAFIGKIPGPPLDPPALSVVRMA